MKKKLDRLLIFVKRPDLLNFYRFSEKTLLSDYRIIILYILFVLFFSVFYFIFEWYEGIDKIDGYLTAAVKTVPLLLEDDFHDRAVAPESISFEEEIKNRIKLNNFSSLTELDWVYTIVKYNNDFYFSAPSVTYEEARKTERWYFYHYNDIPKAFINAYNDEKTVIETYHDQWGSFRSIAEARTSPGGRKYLVCADMNIEKVKKIVMHQYLNSFGVFVLFILLSAGVIIRLVLDRKKIAFMNNELIIHKNNLTDLVEEKSRDIIKINEQLKLTEQQLKITIAEGGMGILKWDSRKDVIIPGDAESVLNNSGLFLKLPGSLSDLLENHIHSDDYSSFKSFFNDIRTGKIDSSKIEFRMKKNNDSFIWMSFLAKRFKSEIPEYSDYIFILFEIIEERKKRELILEKKAVQDSLTGIYNREYYKKYIESLNLNKRLNDFPLTVCYMDINGLKEVNDMFGHPEGDELLQIFCSFVSENLRKTDIFCRIGGDEFLILCPGISNLDFENIWSRITDSTENYNSEKNKPYILLFSHGVIELNHDDLIPLPEKIIALADEIMYLEKKLIKKRCSSVIRDNNG